jgi:hypothetical protein
VLGAAAVVVSNRLAAQPPADVTHDAPSCRVDPADDSVLVDHVGGNVDLLERALDVGV